MKSEATVQKLERLRLAKEGFTLFRNNVGVLRDKRGVPVRYGLANDSSQMNKHVKSSDLIGIRPIVITQDMVGKVIGQFVARECKPEGWVYSGSDREKAQKRFLELIIMNGGDAKFTSGEDDE